MIDKTAILKQLKSCNLNKPYIFVSYSNEDRELVWSDVLEFQRRGFNVWLDEKNLDKTKDSWKEDALSAIEDMDCHLVVFYVSSASLRSEACFQELAKTTDDKTVALHFGPVKFIAIDSVDVGDITDYTKSVFEDILHDHSDKNERKTQALALDGFMKQFFNSNNEKVRIHPKNEANRKSDYYEDILSSFPDETRINPDLIELEAESKAAEEESMKAALEAAKREVEKAQAKAQAAIEEAKRVKEELLKKNTPSSETDCIPIENSSAEPAISSDIISSFETETTSDTFSDAVSDTVTVTDVVPDENDKFTFPPSSSRPASERKTFTKKNIEEAHADNQTYRISNDYSCIALQLFGAVFANTLDMVHLFLPDTLIEIPSSGFKGCTNLEDVRLPQWLKELGYEAFSNCKSLKRLEIPGQVTEIHNRTFENCSSLLAIKLPYGLESIGQAAFKGCSSLESIELPPNLSKIDILCFSECSSLKTIKIPGSVKKIPSSCFSECTSLTKVVIEEGVESIESAFKHQSSNLEIWIPRSVTNISNIAFYKTPVTIHGYADSFAKEFAEKENITFLEIQ